MTTICVSEVIKIHFSTNFSLGWKASLAVVCLSLCKQNNNNTAHMHSWHKQTDRGAQGRGGSALHPSHAPGRNATASFPVDMRGRLQLRARLDWQWTHGAGRKARWLLKPGSSPLRSNWSLTHTPVPCSGQQGAASIAFSCLLNLIGTFTQVPS